MRIPLSNIPDTGWHETLQLPAANMHRLVEAFGDQTAQVTAKISLLPRGGNVELTGSMQVKLNLPCQRCMESVDFPVEESLTVTLAHERILAQAADDHHLSLGELEVVFFSGEEIDLSQVLEDELLILLPDTICAEDDDGNCVCCGRATREVLGEQTNAEENHPFAKMKELLEK